MKDDDEFIKAEAFFNRLDRWMANARVVCLVLALVAFALITFAFLIYVFLTGGAA